MISSTIERLLGSYKLGLNLKGKAETKPGRILMERIPIRTLSEWSDVEPGFYGRLEKLYHTLNPAELKRKIETIKDRLVRLARRKKHTTPLL